MAAYLYFHVPFCIKKCNYCDFLSVPFDDGLSKGYIEALKREIYLKGHETQINTVYIGGGTPTILPEDLIKDIIDSINKAFNLTQDTEITVEANPGTLDERKIDALLSSGVNRISLGVQSFDAKELKSLGRAHSADDAISAIKMLKASGLENISLDLIYGIPGQTIESWENTLKKAVSYMPYHISAYELTPEKGTALYESLRKGETVLPDDDLTADMFDSAVGALTKAGFEHYEISNYALPGRQCRHNLNYWERGEYLGLGAGAHSFVDGKRWSNTRDIKRYITSLREGELSVEGFEDISGEDALKEYVFLGLRKTGGFSINRMPIGAGHLGAFKEKCGEFISEGLMELRGENIRLTGKGIRVYNQVVIRLISVFDKTAK